MIQTILCRQDERRPIDESPFAAGFPLAEPDDETLLHRVQESDMEALGLLFRRCVNLVLEIARRVLRDGDEAEDLVQDFDSITASFGSSHTTTILAHLL